MQMARLMEPWVIALVSAIASGCITVMGAAYWFGRNNVTVNDLHEIRDELREDLALERREMGEGLKTIRQKATDIEIDIAKNYVRRDSWHQAMQQLQENVSKSDAADQQWKLRIEEKLDRMAERIAEMPAVRGRS